MKSAIILAGGKGTRFRSQKQFVDFYGKKLYQHVYDKVVDLVDEVIIVGVDVKAGVTRTESVLNGLSRLSQHSSKVVILEAARPLVFKNQIIKLLESKSNSSSFSVPMVETIIINGCNYPNRNICLSFQTPQAFNTKMLIEAYKNGNFNDMTDETRVIYEYYNELPELLTGGPNLTKVTYPEDLILLESIMKIYNIKIDE
ncbi:MAG: 2-C-methyl-D-erythritol 4-phosphate cytidylyltransferase [Bacteroidetes bacterium]|nr:2-C-methyl-D-erythritol 4-phosphate cytidylyltransferase [Bacteroidota bacterium]